MSGAKRLPSSSVKNATASGCVELDARGDDRLDAPRARRARRAFRRSGRRWRRCRCGCRSSPAASVRSGGQVPTTLPISSIVDAQTEVAHPARRRGRGPARSSSVSASRAFRRRRSAPISASASRRARRRGSEIARRRRASAHVIDVARADGNARARRRPVAARIAATIAGVDEIVGGSPDTLRAERRAGLGLLDEDRVDGRRVERGRDQVVGEARRCAPGRRRRSAPPSPRARRPARCRPRSGPVTCSGLSTRPTSCAVARCTTRTSPSSGSTSTTARCAAHANDTCASPWPSASSGWVSRWWYSSVDVDRAPGAVSAATSTTLAPVGTGARVQFRRAPRGTPSRPRRPTSSSGGSPTWSPRSRSPCRPARRSPRRRRGPCARSAGRGSRSPGRPRPPRTRSSRRRRRCRQRAIEPSM